MNVFFEFPLQAQVRVKAIKAQGFITGLLRDADGCQYRVAYWDSSQRRVEWMFAPEIEFVELA